MRKYYQQDAFAVLQDVSGSPQGLTKQEVSQRQEQYGKNVLLETKAKPAWKIFFEQFKDLLVLILIAAAMISMASGEWESTIVILAVITMNAILGTLQSIKAQKSLAALKKLSMPHTRVIRDGKTMEIASSELTVGDIMLLEAGDVVGADGRILENYSLQVNESTLTGEVESVQKISESIREECGIGDQKNMVFSSGSVTYGRAKCVVTAVGMETEIGKIAALMNMTKERRTPLQQTLDDFSKKLSIAILAICALVFVMTVSQGNAVLDALMFAVALAVAAIPEALASIVTIVLAMGTAHMAKEHAIVKHLNSVESLGCVSVICSDKTGTLTQNKMSAQQIYRSHELLAADRLSKEQVLDQRLLQVFALCNNAQTSEEQRIGDPTELALIDLLEQYGLDEAALRQRYPRLDENPFDSKRKLMSTMHEIDGQKLLVLKGACDELLHRAVKIQMLDGIRPLSESDKEQILAVNKRFAEEGLRVLGFAMRNLKSDAASITLQDEEELTFLGLISLMDPPRVESKQAVQDCLAAGIVPVMITGDHKLTAQSIAKQLGIYRQGDECVDGRELSAMSEEELQKRLTHIRVYARVAPEHKIRIVRAWQKAGHIAAMTGDGVNDAPALKQADIGIAMGISGTEVSKEAAGMILTDDNFATIVKAVAAGRSIYANIKHSILYLLSGNLSGIISVLIASLSGLPLPFLPVHLLFINLVTDSLPAIAIGMEPAAKNMLKEKPRDPQEGILNASLLRLLILQGILIAASTMGAYGIGLQSSEAEAATMAFSTLCLARLFHGFNCRGNASLKKLGFFSNPYSIGAFIIGFLLLNVILLVPAFHGLFAVTTLSTAQLLLIYALAFAPTLLIQLVRSARGK